MRYWPFFSIHTAHDVFVNVYTITETLDEEICSSSAPSGCKQNIIHTSHTQKAGNKNIKKKTNGKDFCAGHCLSLFLFPFLYFVSGFFSFSNRLGWERVGRTSG
jgi:hypothetical protein